MKNRITKKGFMLLLFVLGMNIGAFAQSMMVKGTVIDYYDQEPMIGVNVLVQGTTNGTITDMDGNFSLTGVREGDTLVFSYIGMKTFKVGIHYGQFNLKIIMHGDDAEITDNVYHSKIKEESFQFYLRKEEERENRMA